MTARGERTRERILDAAELLYGERGVDGVSLREIRLASGQRNTTAIQFHFGDANGVLRALADRHMPRVAAIQERLRDALDPTAEGDVETLVETMVRPWAEYTTHGPATRAWVRIAAEMSARPDRLWVDFRDHAPTVVIETAIAVLGHLEPRLGRRLAVDRLTKVGLIGLHLCADRARQTDAPRPSDLALLGHDDWTADLVAMAIAAALAPDRRSARSPAGAAGPGSPSATQAAMTPSQA